jgi:hypothetical protein
MAIWRMHMFPSPFKSALIILAASVALIAQSQGQVKTVQIQPIGPYEDKKTASADTAMSDSEALKSAGLTAEDGAKLIEYLKQRTLSDVDQGKIAGIIKRFGADDFEERVKATEEIELYGAAAIGPLKAAERDSDPEVAYRAKAALKRMTKVPHTLVTAAAVRAIVKLKPAGAAGALINFLPLADDETNSELIRNSLVEMAVKEGKADPDLVAALHDSSPLRRSAAYVALTLGGPATERIRIKDAYPKLREAILREKDPEAKFIGLWTLLRTTLEKEFIPELIGLIPQVSRGRLWQLEDLLLRMAGSHVKDGRFLKTPEQLSTARDVWLAWWKEKGDKIDYAKLDYKPSVLGVTDVLEIDRRGYGQSRIISLGPDMKEKWRVSGLNDPNDFLYLSNDKILVVESNMHQISERTSAGAIRKRHNVLQQPLNITKSSDGGVLVFCRNRIVDFDKDWTQRGPEHPRPNFDVMTGIRLPQGDVLCVTNAFQGVNCVRLDSKLKETNTTYTFGRIQNYQSMDAVGDEKILVCEHDRVAEYDLKTGKQTWKHECSNPTSCQRLVNGNTLIALLNANLLIEVDPSGETVWEYAAKDGLRVGRARRR